MDADEKLTALKKAYADIILNTSKEAATRVMASEGKEVRCQHELKETNEEALRLMLRLKQMMDSKISEAEALSLNQQKKIEEFEAQLHEAEDIVRDLREELREVLAELERVKNDNFQPVNEPDNSCPGEIPLDNRMYSYPSSTILPPKLKDESAVASDVAMPFLSRRNECPSCYNKIVCMCSSYIGNRDLPSIISRRKEPGLYRNGCTQRIRACERNLLDRELCFSGKTDKVKGMRNAREIEEGEETCKSPASGTKPLSELKKKLLTDTNNASFVPFLQKRKRSISRRKTITHLSGKQPDLFLKPNQLPELSVRTDPISIKDSAHYSENPSKNAPRLSTDKSELQIQPGYAASSEKETNLVEIGGAKAMQKDEGLIENMVPVREKIEFAESTSFPDCKMELEQVDVPLKNLETNSSNTTKGLLRQPVRERVIKYTYQRKRRRSALSRSDLKGSLGTEKKMGDKPNGDQKLERPKSSLLVESVKGE